GICIGCTMPGFPDKFMPFMDEPPGAKVSTRMATILGSTVRTLRGFTEHTLDAEPKWRHRGSELTTGYRPTWRGRVGERGTAKKTNGLVEMNWDPVTRIVGSLGIYTKIDFGKKRVAECHSTSSIFRGYSVFMKGKDPRDSHFITSRICGICG